MALKSEVTLFKHNRLDMAHATLTIQSTPHNMQWLHIALLAIAWANTGVKDVHWLHAMLLNWLVQGTTHKFDLQQSLKKKLYFNEMLSSYII